jgi:phage terminase small subunit
VYALSDKQEKFLRAILLGVPASKAYLDAGFKAPSAKDAASSALKLIKSPKFAQARADAEKAAGLPSETEKAAAVAKERVEAAAVVHAATVMSATEVLEHLTEIAAGRVLDVDSEGAPCSPKVSDRLRALELLGKRHKLFTDKVETKHDVSKSFADLVISDERRVG